MAAPLSDDQPTASHGSLHVAALSSDNRPGHSKYFATKTTGMFALFYSSTWGYCIFAKSVMLIKWDQQVKCLPKILKSLRTLLRCNIE
jgi:hypothetical protein